MTAFTISRDKNQTPVWDVPPADTADTFAGNIAANTDVTVTVPTGSTLAFINVSDAAGMALAWYWAADSVVPDLTAFGAALTSQNVHSNRTTIPMAGITVLHIRCSVASNVNIEFFSGVS